MLHSFEPCCILPDSVSSKAVRLWLVFYVIGNGQAGNVSCLSIFGQARVIRSRIVPAPAETPSSCLQTLSHPALAPLRRTPNRMSAFFAGPLSCFAAPSNASACRHLHTSKPAQSAAMGFLAWRIQTRNAVTRLLLCQFTVPYAKWQKRPTAIYMPSHKTSLSTDLRLRSMAPAVCGAIDVLHGQSVQPTRIRPVSS